MYAYSENEKYENGSNLLFLDLEDYLPFSFVQLGRVFVHSDPIFCTFGFIFVQKVKQFVQLVNDSVQLHFVHLVLSVVHLVYTFVHLVLSAVHLVVSYVQMGG